MNQFVKISLNFFKDNWFKIGIILAITICGSFIYQAQLMEQKSVERQQQMALQAKTEKDKADEIFTNNLKCQDLLKDLKQRWNNVVGIYYQPPTENNFFNKGNTCIVKYTKNGETLEAPVEDMQDTN